MHSPKKAACRNYLTLALVSAALPVHAANILVDTLDDEVNKDKKCSLREAIINANSNDQSGSKACAAGAPGVDFIVFDPELGGGTIALTKQLPVIAEALEITGPVPDYAAGLTLDGQNNDRVFQIKGAIPNEFPVALRGLSVVNGLAFSLLSPQGGGIDVTNADLKLVDVTVANNRTTGVNGWGGGISVKSGNADLSRTTVADNTTEKASAVGGGLHVSNGDVHVTDSTFSTNRTLADSTPGGGIFVAKGDLVVTNSTFSSNRAQGVDSVGGGLYTDDGNITLLHATLYNNSSPNVVGDGDNVHLNNPGNTFTLLNSLIVQTNGATQCSKQADVLNSSLSTHAGCTGIATPLNNIALDTLKNNGGPTQTHQPGPFSDALETADKGICTALDQRGAPRPYPVGKQCDIGAFEVTGLLDMGDAPTALQSGFEFIYPTLFGSQGAGHVIIPNAPFLGVLIDAENNGQPLAGANGDDDHNLPDEDGIFFASDLIRGQDATIDVTVTNGPATLDAWMDFNTDGDFDDPDEQIFVGQPVANGNNPGLSFAVPGSASLGKTFARFRLSSKGGLTPRGLATDGEVEDYAVTITKKKGGGGGSSGGGGCSLLASSTPDPLLPLFALLALLYLARKSSRRV